MNTYGSIPLVLLFLIAITLAPAAQAQVGALDVTFDGDGMRTDSLSLSDVASEVAVQSDGDIVVFGRSENPNNANTRNGRVTIYRPDGSLDESWVHAPLQFGCGSVPNHFSTGLVTSSDEILAAGVTLDGCSAGASNFDVVRYDPDGGTGFIFSGKPVFHGSYDEAFGLAYQSDGKIIAVGLANPSGDAALARYLSDGSLDGTFGTGGEVLIDLAGGADRIRAVQVQPDGKIVAAGQAEVGGQDDALLVRLHPDGTLDPSFGDDGIVTRDFHGFDDLFRDLALQSDGKIVVAGRQTEADGTTTRFTVSRFHPDGVPDAAFGTDGVVVVDFTGLSAAATGIALQADDKIVVGGMTETGTGGRSTRAFAIARLHPDGTLDPSFDGDGRNTADIFSDRADTALGLAIEPSGHIVLAGVTDWEDGDDTFRNIALARFVGDSAPLPVELTSFEALLDGEQVVLAWTTASETNNAGFDLQMQSAGADHAWEHVAFVEGSGTTHSPRSYRYRMSNLANGAHRFRLKQIDTDGSFAFSPVVEVTLGTSLRFALHGAYPNPSGGTATIPFEVAQAGTVRIAVYDMLGRQVAVLVDEEYAPGRHQVQLDASQLPTGLYVYRIRMDDVEAARTIAVVR